LTLIGKWLSESNLKIPIDSTYNVKAMAAAMLKQSGKKKGRVAIKVENGWS
jgi:NADPH:quinone reductase-like Zn-dependent oxidoreductase